MSDWKSKLPSFQEVASMTTKLAKDIKNSVCEIIDDYKQKHPDVPAETEKAKAKESPKAEEKVETKAAAKEDKKTEE